MPLKNEFTSTRPPRGQPPPCFLRQCLRTPTRVSLKGLFTKISRFHSRFRKIWGYLLYKFHVKCRPMQGILTIFSLRLNDIILKGYYTLYSKQGDILQETYLISSLRLCENYCKIYISWNARSIIIKTPPWVISNLVGTTNKNAIYSTMAL